MNPVFHEAAQTAQYGWVMGVMTVVFLVVFVGWALWAWAPSNSKLMEDAANLPFDDDEVK